MLHLPTNTKPHFRGLHSPASQRQASTAWHSPSAAPKKPAHGTDALNRADLAVLAVPRVEVARVRVPDALDVLLQLARLLIPRQYIRGEKAAGEVCCWDGPAEQTLVLPPHRPTAVWAPPRLATGARCAAVSRRWLKLTSAGRSRSSRSSWPPGTHTCQAARGGVGGSGWVAAGWYRGQIAVGGRGGGRQRGSREAGSEAPCGAGRGRRVPGAAGGRAVRPCSPPQRANTGQQPLTCTPGRFFKDISFQGLGY